MADKNSCSGSCKKCLCFCSDIPPYKEPKKRVRHAAKKHPIHVRAVAKHHGGAEAHHGR